MIQANLENVLLDANVLYPAPLRDFLLNIAEQNIYSPKWSDEIQSEWSRSLLLKRTDLKRSPLDRTIRLMNLAFKDANVLNYKSIESELILPDPNDRHVLAAAVKSKSRILLTNNLKDFPKKEFDKY